MGCFYNMSLIYMGYQKYKFYIKQVPKSIQVLEKKNLSRPGKQAAGAWMRRSSCRGRSTLVAPFYSDGMGPPVSNASGKHRKNDGKSPFLMGKFQGKSTISTGPFSIAMLV